MKTLTTDVLVVGAGPAGLTASALLARAGIDSLTVTKYGTANSPRAHITNQRTVEILRDLGIEDAVMARALPQQLMGKQVFATAFAGRELSRMMTWGTGPDRLGDYIAASPCEMCNAPQHIMEPIILERARELGAEIRLHSEAVTVREDDEGVTVRVRPRDGSEEYDVRAKYVLGCDGARTLVGAEGGFEFDGESGLGTAITVWIEADLTQYAQHRSGALFVVCKPGSDDLVSIWTCIEPWTEWSTIFVRHEQKPNELSEELVMQRVRDAIGNDDIDVKIKHISEWEFNHVVAKEYRRGRLFIAGDAAHRHPPANGLGSNTSIQDAYNLVWKLSMVLRGQAGEGLLDSYNEERQPVGRQVVDRANQSVGEMLSWLGPIGLRPGQTEAEANAVLDEIFGPAGEPQRQELLAGLDVMNAQFNAHGIELGQRYVSGAVVNEPDTAPRTGLDADLIYEATTLPGAALPHAWIGRDTHDVSTLDLCAYDRFTLFVGVDSRHWVDAAGAVAAELGVEIEVRVVALGQDLNDVLGDWTRQREVDDTGCVLVRPDRYIAWRCATAGDDPPRVLGDAMTNVLS